MERILLVEDDSAIYQPLTSFLRGEGFAVRQASGQREALALLETEEFDLVLLDVGLRDGNGFSVCSAVKQRGGTAVIFLSASGDEYSVVTGLDLGADDYIAKPSARGSLSRASAACCAARPRPRPNRRSSATRASKWTCAARAARWTARRCHSPKRSSRLSR